MNKGQLLRKTSLWSAQRGIHVYCRETALKSNQIRNGDQKSIHTRGLALVRLVRWLKAVTETGCWSQASIKKQLVLCLMERAQYAPRHLTLQLPFLCAAINAVISSLGHFIIQLEIYEANEKPKNSKRCLLYTILFVPLSQQASL